jgi:hypothetical protein
MALVKQFEQCWTRKPLEINGSVAVVGNSDLLAGNQYGSEIDSQDNVFRFNLASLDEEYHASTGSRADFYLLSQNITTLRYPHPEPLQSRFNNICRNSIVICYPGHEKNIQKYQKPYLLTHDVTQVNQLIEQVLGHPAVEFPPKNHPRNGVKLVIALVAAGIKPTLYGFDMETRPAPNHYYDEERQREVAPGTAGHLPSLEYELLAALAVNQLIVVRP